MDDFLQSVAITTIVLILPVIAAGSLLPFWMFINSLQIIAHMPLLKSLMPANVHYFLTKFLNWLRLYEPSFVDYLDDTYHFKTHALNKDVQHVLLEACDYKAPFIKSMIFILLLFAIILLGY